MVFFKQLIIWQKGWSWLQPDCAGNSGVDIAKSEELPAWSPCNYSGWENGNRKKRKRWSEDRRNLLEVSGGIGKSQTKGPPPRKNTHSFGHCPVGGGHLHKFIWKMKKYAKLEGTSLPKMILKLLDFDSFWFWHLKGYFFSGMAFWPMWGNVTFAFN